LSLTAFPSGTLYKHFLADLAFFQSNKHEKRPIRIFELLWRLKGSLVIKDLTYEAKAKTFFLKAKAKDIKKNFQGQHQGQLSQSPLRAKICIASETVAYLIKHNAKETICGGFGVQC